MLTRLSLTALPCLAIALIGCSDPEPMPDEPEAPAVDETAGLADPAAGEVTGPAAPVSLLGEEQPEFASETQTWPGTEAVSRQGPVFFSGQPDEDGFRHAAKLGIQTIINLRPEEEMETKVSFDEPALVASLELDYVALPITPETFSMADVEKLAAILDAPGGAVLLQCSTANRSGGLWTAFLRLKRGLTYDQAMARGKAAGLKKAPMIEAVERVLAENQR